MNADMELGRVAVNGEDQFITSLIKDNKQGIELRTVNINVVADSQWQGGFSLPASGWDVDFQQVSAELNIPPGWRLLAVSGAASRQPVVGYHNGPYCFWSLSLSLVSHIFGVN
jgi:hypothetical protein